MRLSSRVGPSPTVPHGFDLLVLPRPIDINRNQDLKP